MSYRLEQQATKTYVLVHAEMPDGVPMTTRERAYTSPIKMRPGVDVVLMKSQSSVVL
jgi:hypothetical protein